MTGYHRNENKKKNYPQKAICQQRMKRSIQYPTSTSIVEPIPTISTLSARPDTHAKLSYIQKKKGRTRGLFESMQVELYCFLALWFIYRASRLDRLAYLQVSQRICPGVWPTATGDLIGEDRSETGLDPISVPMLLVETPAMDSRLRWFLLCWIRHLLLIPQTRLTSERRNRSGSSRCRRSSECPRPSSSCLLVIRRHTTCQT
ncbi:hypothetical protein V8F33_012248 [Rhypophila sp. PSN 637]